MRLPDAVQTRDGAGYRSCTTSSLGQLSSTQLPISLVDSDNSHARTEICKLIVM